MNTGDKDPKGPETENTAASESSENSEAQQPDSITEESLTAFLRNGESVAGMAPTRRLDQPDLENENPIPDEADESDRPLDEENAQIPEDDLNGVSAVPQTEIRAEDILSRNGNGRVRTHEIDQVFGAMSRLQELDELLKDLNFGEMIMRFGQLQAEVDVLRDGLDAISGILEKSRATFAGNPEQTDDMEQVITGFLDHVDQTSEALEASDRMQSLGKSQCLNLVSQVLDSLKTLHSCHVSRLSMSTQLAAMVESDTPNEQLASAALEFAVYLKELDAPKDLEAFEQAMTELEVLRDEFRLLEERVEPELITEDLDKLKVTVQDIRQLPELVGNARDLINSLDQSLQDVRSQLSRSITENGNPQETAVPDGDGHE